MLFKKKKQQVTQVRRGDTFFFSNLDLFPLINSGTLDGLELLVCTNSLLHPLAPVPLKV